MKFKGLSMHFNKDMNILCVEDVEIDVENIKRSFKKNDIKNELYTAENGEEALRMLREEIRPLPHIILLDINMPRMNGLEFLAELRKDDKLKHIQVFVLTTSDQDKDIIDAHKYNVAGYIVKPVDTIKLTDAVGKLRDVWENTQYPPTSGD